MRKENPAKGLSTPMTQLLFAIRQFDFSHHSLQELKSRLAAARDNVAETYAILREIIHRFTGLLLFDSQLAAAYAMQLGRIAELPTGEGKTLSAVVTAATFALRGEPVHVLVFNDYLAQRDYSANKSIYEACGLSCGYVVQRSTPEQRKGAYACQVVYVSAKEVGFDHLRDFLCMEPAKLLLRTFPVALVDEADSILIDEARIPLVLAGNRDVSAAKAERICEAVTALSTDCVSVSLAENQAWLTDIGIEAMQSALQNNNLYASSSADTLAQINAALEARFLVAKDKDYIVKEGRILLVDEATGRVAENRKFPDLLQQAVEIREGLAQAAQTVVYNSMSLQAFLRQYRRLCGMTGTASSSAVAFKQMYGLEVEVVPPHTPCIRADHEDAVFPDAVSQMAAMLACVQVAQEKGQPVLIGTRSVAESEALSLQLTQHGLPHRVLNARNDEEEAAVIAEAGRARQITISTNMAGRGVDIRLGGSASSDAGMVRNAGGLYVMSTGINRSLRVDNQLRGRSGRQGDPGESRFFVNLADIGPMDIPPAEIRQANVPGKTDAGLPAVPPHAAKRLRRAQREQEGRDTEARYMLERYSALLEEKRMEITAYRTGLLLLDKSPVILQNGAPEVWESLVQVHGPNAVMLAERQLTLLFISRHWSDFLSAVEDKRSGIHLEVVGGKNPLEEYRRFIVFAFDEMQKDLRRDVVDWMQRCSISENGIDLEAEGLSGATTTWTYLINDSADQFNRIPFLIKTVSNSIRGTLFTVRGLRVKWKQWVLRGKGRV